MENASKALTIAAGVLIAIVIISVLVRTMSTVNSFQKENLSEEEQRQLVEYNEQYTKYVNQYMYGTEIMTIINKHNDIVNHTERSYPLTVKISFINAYTYTNYETGAQETLPNPAILDADSTTFITTSSNVESFRNRAFRCKEVTYDNNTGRIDSISFEEIPT